MLGPAVTVVAASVGVLVSLAIGTPTLAGGLVGALVSVGVLRRPGAELAPTSREPRSASRDPV